jgi:hypothetical protein
MPKRAEKGSVMAFKKVNIGGIENLIDFEVGVTVEGVFNGLATHTAKDNEVHEIGKIKIGDEDKVFFNGGQLKFLLNHVEVGKRVRITYLGKTENEVMTKKGGMKKIHQYKVEVEE